MSSTLTQPKSSAPKVASKTSPPDKAKPATDKVATGKPATDKPTPEIWIDGYQQGHKGVTRRCAHCAFAPGQSVRQIDVALPPNDWQE